MFLAYQYVTIAILLADANFYADKLNLPVSRPVREEYLTFKIVTPASIVRADGAGGRLDFEGYSVSEGSHPHCFITKLDPFEGRSIADQNEILSHQKSLVDSKGAYQLATNWLARIGVDVLELEKGNKLEVQQRWFWGKGTREPRILLPIFEVKWGGTRVEVVVDGRTKGFLSIRMLDQASFSRRPCELVRGLDKLLAISDAEFLTYSQLGRSNLVARFAAVDCQNPGQTNAPPTKR
jgi:hypothetical protein